MTARKHRKQQALRKRAQYERRKAAGLDLHMVWVPAARWPELAQMLREAGCEGVALRGESVKFTRKTPE